MREPIPKDDFPFRVIRYTGLVLIVVGIVAVAFDLGDVVYTAAKYTSGCDNTQFTTDPCSNSVLKWTWTASGVWGGLLFIAAGVIGFRLYGVGEYYLRFYRDAFGVCVVLGSLIVGPAMLSLSVLEILYGVDIFYTSIDGDFTLYDSAKFLLPTLNVAAGFILWVTSTVACVFVCCCAHFVEESYEEDHYEDRYYDDRRRDDDYSSFRRRTPRRRSRRVKPMKRLERRPRRMPVERYSPPQRPRTYDYAMPRRALPAPRLPAIMTPMNEPPYALSASNLSLGSLSRPMYASPYAPYSFGAPWGGYA